MPNFTLAGDWTSQKFLGSMEGAVLAGKLAAEVIAVKHSNMRSSSSITTDNSKLLRVKDIQPEIVNKIKAMANLQKPK